MASLKNLTANADPHVHVGGIQSYQVVCASCGRVSISRRNTRIVRRGVTAERYTSPAAIRVNELLPTRLGQADHQFTLASTAGP